MSHQFSRADKGKGRAAPEPPAKRPPEKFQMRFQSEEDMERVLTKGPYHYKKWMLLLQRWEPVVSENFPSLISFWIKIHDLPLHFWNEGTITIIGDQLGHMPDKVVEEAKIRVEINGLEPLVMDLEIQLPSDEILPVEFEYMKLEKHCFTCFSLFHEEVNYPLRSRHDAPARDRKLGITQRLALQRIEADKRRHDDRRGYQRPSAEFRPHYDRRDERNSRRTYSDHRDLHTRSTGGSSPYRSAAAPASLRYRPSDSVGTKASEDNDSRVLSSGVVIRHQDIPVDNASHPSANAGVFNRFSSSQISHTPSPRNLRERLEYPNDVGSTGGTPNPSSRKRRLSLGRTTEPDLRELISPRPTSSLDSGRLQEVEIQYDGVENEHISPVVTNSSALPPRIPAALRLSDGQRDEAGPSSKLFTATPPLSKTAGKRKVPRVTTKRVVRSPMRALNLRRAAVGRSANPPKKNLCVDKEPLPCDKAGTSSKSRGSTGRRGSDFRPPPPPLP